MSSKTKYRRGDRVVTSAAYARATNFKKPIVGFLIKQTGWQADVWLVMMDDFEVPQRVHQSMFAKMTEGRTMDTSKVTKMGDRDWVKHDKVEWRAEIKGDPCPARIRQLDAKTFAVYRAGRYLGCEMDFALADERVKLGVRSEINREMDWQRAHPDEQPLGLRLTTEERAAIWPARPASGAKAAPPPATAPRASSGAAGGRGNGGLGPEKATRAPKAEAGSKDAEIATMLRRGCTSEEVLRVTGWKAVSMPAMAKKLGLGLRIEKGAKPYKYYSTAKEK